MEGTGQMNLAMDFGGGRQVDLEAGEAEPVWVAVGPGYSRADVWVKATPEMIELRVRIRRTAGGVQIDVDRGDDQAAWWPPDAAPRLEIVISMPTGTATAAASVGKAGGFQQVLLGRANI